MRWALFGLLVGGCSYKVKLTSAPMPAEVLLPDQSVRITPVDVKLRYLPFQHQWVTVTAPGYRTLTMDLRKSEIKLQRYVTDAVFQPNTWVGAPRGEVRFVLVPEHGPVGTWSEEDAP